LPAARERVIATLASHFANDDLTLDELERRIERVYQSSSLADLEALTADLRLAAPPAAARDRPSARAIDPMGSFAPAREAREYDRILSIMGETRRTGVWPVPRRLRLMSIMSDTRIDLTLAQLPPGEVEIDVGALMTSLRIVVPPGMRVSNEMSAIMSSVTSDTDDAPLLPNAPVIRLTGLAFMCDVRVVVQSRGAITGVSE
jgi:hypothetical protein